MYFVTLHGVFVDIPDFSGPSCPITGHEMLIWVQALIWHVSPPGIKEAPRSSNLTSQTTISKTQILYGVIQAWGYKSLISSQNSEQ